MVDKGVLRWRLEAGFIDQGTLFAPGAHMRQGGIIPPVIANRSLDRMEAAVGASVGPTQGARLKFKVKDNT